MYRLRLLLLETELDKPSAPLAELQPVPDLSFNKALLKVKELSPIDLDRDKRVGSNTYDESMILSPLLVLRVLPGGKRLLFERRLEE